MTVQTIPDIEDMTAAQQMELMEALWKSMSERNINGDPPDWHLKYLDNCEKDITNGNDGFISVDEFEADLRHGLK
jgi:hypothetical protein